MAGRPPPPWGGQGMKNKNRPPTSTGRIFEQPAAWGGGRWPLPNPIPKSGYNNVNFSGGQGAQRSLPQALVFGEKKRGGGGHRGLPFLIRTQKGSRLGPAAPAKWGEGPAQSRGRSLRASGRQIPGGLSLPDTHWQCVRTALPSPFSNLRQG